jgi:hypothetical protein
MGIKHTQPDFLLMLSVAKLLKTAPFCSAYRVTSTDRSKEFVKVISSPT